MNWRSPRFLLLLAVFIVLVVSIGVIIVTLIFQADHAKISTQHTDTQKTVIPTNERQVVQTYNQALAKQNWATIYATTSNIVVGNYTPDQFAQMMAQQVQDVGTVSSISTTSNPEVKTNPDGTLYFTINEQVVFIKNGVSQTQSLISIFILEDGTWKFWFSKKV